MNSPISITDSAIGGQTVQTVNARDLHASLEVGKDFSTWVKAQIKRADLAEGIDYLLTQKGEQLPSGTKWLTEYNLTIEAAKNIAMLSGTAKGKEVRAYFIECERKAQNPALQIKNPVMQAIIAQALEFDRLEQEQRRQSTEIARIHESVAVIEARTQPENRHFTVLGYASLMGRPLDLRTAANLGRKCANLSREQGMLIGDVTDPRFGKVHTYHESILDAVCCFGVSA